MTPEQRARLQIDELLHHAGWLVQDRDGMNLWAVLGVAVREAHLKTGFADYLLFVGGKALGVIEVKKGGNPLSGVEAQSQSYAMGLQDLMQGWRPDAPLPFRYESTGIQTYFTNTLDPESRSRLVFAFHRPDTLKEWGLEEQTLRRAELVALQLEDHIYKEENELIVSGKGNMQRAVSLGHAAAALTDWLLVRGAAFGPLFLGLGNRNRGRRLTDQAVYNMLRKQAKAAGVKNLSPHDFRRTLSATCWTPAPTLSRCRRWPAMPAPRRPVGMTAEDSGPDTRRLPCCTCFIRKGCSSKKSGDLRGKLTEYIRLKRNFDSHGCEPS